MPPCDSRCWVSASRAKRLIYIDAQDAQDFFRKRLARSPEHPQTRTGSLLEPAPAQEPLVLMTIERQHGWGYSFHSIQSS